MRLSDSLEVAIGLSFVFLVASLVLTSVREAIEAVTKLRGRTMFRGIAEMLHDRDLGIGNAEALARALYRHPLISGLMKGTVDDPDYLRNLPSYLPSRNFALALMAQTMAGKFALAAPPDTAFPAASALPAVQQLRLLAQSIENNQLRHALVHAIDTGAGDFDSVRGNLEAWFDGAMDRVSGFYKRRSQFILFGLGLAMAVALNINTVTIANALFAAPAMREALSHSPRLVRASGDCVIAPPGGGSASGSGAADASQSGGTASQSRSGGTAGTLPPCSNADLIDALSAADLPFGWSEASRAALLAPVRGSAAAWKFVGLIGIIGGWLLTAFAVCLGAPFWFSVLNRLSMMRNALKPGETTEGTPDPQLAGDGAMPQTSTLTPPPSAGNPPSCRAIDHAVYAGTPPTGAGRLFEDDEGKPVTGIAAEGVQ